MSPVVGVGESSLWAGLGGAEALGFHADPTGRVNAWRSESKAKQSEYKMANVGMTI